MIAFFLGLVIGGTLGVLFMCLCQVSGEYDRREENCFKEENQHGKQ